MKQRTRKPTLEQIARQIRADILISTTAAGSGHPTSSLSAVELMTELLFGGIFRADLRRPALPNNDRLVFSKGHAAPLLYALYATAGKVSERELKTLRRFGSRLEGHPAMTFPYTEVPTGSLGQGLAQGLGIALAARMQGLSYRSYILLGDGELAEGSVWEAAQLAGQKEIHTLTAIVDINRLGQTGQTMFGHSTSAYAQRFRAFGWHAIEIGGHDLAEVRRAYRSAVTIKNKPTAILARTLKGKGVSFLENRNGWHGKALSQDELKRALSEIGRPKERIECVPRKPRAEAPKKIRMGAAGTTKRIAGNESPREAFGRALVSLAARFPRVVVLDGDVKNSTFVEYFARRYPSRFFELFIAEQSMVGVASGLSARGLLPVVATFSAFFTRAFDQLRLLQHAKLNLVFAGTHAGVSIGQDGPSQMGLEDISLFRTLQNSTILYPADACATQALLLVALKTAGIVYLRLGRNPAPQVHTRGMNYMVGGSNTLVASRNDHVTLIGCGVTVHEALIAAGELKKGGINARVIDLYSIKPLDRRALAKAARETRHLIVAEDHVPEGGVAEAVRSALGRDAGAVISLAVRRRPKSGSPEQLLGYEKIDAAAFLYTAKQCLKQANALIPTQKSQRSRD